MAVQKIKQYGDILKVILDSKIYNFDKCEEDYDYFFISTEDKNLLHLGNNLKKYYKSVIFVNSENINSKGRVNAGGSLERQILKKYYDMKGFVSDHYNHCKYDNVRSNLKPVSSQQNSINRQVRGYTFEKGKGFKVTTFRYNSFFEHPIYDYVDTELEVLQQVYDFEEKYLNPYLLSQGLYSYNFFEDRSKCPILLHNERVGILTPEDATFRHILLDTNDWHYYRYNLAEYFKDNGIPFSGHHIDFDDNGFMIDKFTRKRMCPI